MSDLEIVYSPLSGEFTRERITVMVEIYRFSDSEGWTLEVTHHDSPTLWTEEFATDQAAFSSFVAAMDNEGLKPFVKP